MISRFVLNRSLKITSRTIVTLINSSNKTLIQQRTLTMTNPIVNLSSLNKSFFATTSTNQSSFSTSTKSTTTNQSTAFVGDFAGVISFGAVKLRLQLHIATTKDDRWQVTLDSVDQSAFGIKCNDASYMPAEHQMVFDFSNIGARYVAQLVDGDSRLRGQWFQGGSNVHLELQRTTTPLDQSSMKRPQEPTPPFPYDSREVTYRNEQDDVTIAGTLTLPSAAAGSSQQPFPAVILITGSGAQNRDEEIFGHKPFLVIADHLTRRGIAVLRCDDRGVGGTTGSTANSTSAQLADDVVCGIKYLRTLKEIDPNRIGLLGHSEGGVIAPMVVFSIILNFYCISLNNNFQI